MTPIGQPGILAMLQKSKDRMRAEEVVRREKEDGQKGEQQVVGARKVELVRKEQSCSEHVKKDDGIDQEAEELTKGLVFNYMIEVVPSLALEFGSSFDVTRNSLHLKDVLRTVQTTSQSTGLRSPTSSEPMTNYPIVSTEDLVKAVVLRYLGREAPSLVREFTERFDPGETGLELEEVLRGCRGEKKTAYVKSRKKPNAGKRNKKIGTSHRGYMEHEDAVIRAAHSGFKQETAGSQVFLN